ncbi:MAG: sporulation protein [Firmicutes bacterium]|nr:sporulation protein [Bacillota bacterium]
MKEKDKSVGGTISVDIQDLLYRMGVTAKYIGFFHTACAVELAMEDPERLLLVTKWLYPDVAERYDTSWKSVERNIRTAANVAWQANPELLSEYAGFTLSERPCNSQFLAILANYCSREKAS